MDEHLLRFDKEKTLLFIDVETENLNLNPEYNLPWQIAMIKVIGGDIIERYDWMVKWHRPLNVGAGARFVTGFNDENYEEFSIDYQKVIPKVTSEIQEADYVVGHNFLGFDIYFMLYIGNIMKADFSELAFKILDTNCLAKGIKIPIPFDPKNESLLEYQYKLLHKRVRGLKTNLKALGQELQIDHDYSKLHNALVDLELNVKVWNKLKMQINI